MASGGLPPSLRGLGMSQGTAEAGLDGSLGVNWHGTLPSLTEQTELQKMVSNEKMRSEQHKTNYQTLKVEHTRLQDEYLTMQQDMRSTIEESKLVHEKYKGLLEQTRKELAAKHAHCEELRSQVLDDEKLELVKLQVREDVEMPFRAKFAKVTDELEAYRSEFNKLKYEHSFLKSEYEHEKSESQRVIEELKLRHEAEVLNLRKERETLLARQHNDGSQDTQRVRVLQRENAQLNLKVKGLLTELDEIRAQREHQGLQSDHVSRMQSKQLAEHTVNIKSLETERESLKLQLENLQREMTLNSDTHTQLTTQVHDLEKDNIVLKNRAEEVGHKAKVEVTNMKMDMLKERGELERDRDRLHNELEELKSQLEISQHQIDQQSSALVEKERDAVKRMQAAREEEWQKTHRVENEKLELETKLQELERMKIDEESRRQAEKERVEEKIKGAMEAKDVAEREALVLKTKMQQQTSLMDHLERERTENSELKVRMHRLETEYASYANNETELLDLNTRLKTEVDRQNEDLRRARDEVMRGRDALDKGLVEQRGGWLEEKANMQRRVDDLEGHLSNTQIKVATLANAQKKKKKKYIRVACKLKDRVALLQARNEELQIERDTLKKSVPPDTHLKLKKQMNDLLRRHREYRTVLTSHDLSTVPIGDLSFTSASGVPLVDGTDNWTFLDNEHHQKDLQRLKERLDTLDDNQRAQLDEFRTFAQVSTPVKEGQSHQRLFLSSSDSDEDDKDRQPEKEQVT